MVLSIVGMHPHLLSGRRVLLFGTFLTLVLFLYVYSTPPSFSKVFQTPQATCLPRAYSNGSWRGPYPRTNAMHMLDKTQALQFSGFSGCASSREFWWHLAADNEEQWDRFPAAQSYRWAVGKDEGCEGLRQINQEAMVADLVEQGGWLLVGDSITEGHFFSLSCMLYPHVIATPTYTPNSYFDRAWPQNLYLNPESPLLQPNSRINKNLVFPPGFNITSTPLVTFRRIDLLFTQPELVDLHQTLHPDAPSNFSLFSNEATWSMSPSEYTALFLSRGYSTMIVSTAGHWTTTLFGGYGEKNEVVLEDARKGIDGVLDFFEHAMTKWAGEVQSMLDDAARKEGGRKKREVVVRAYLTGHEDCHKHKEPWKEIQPMVWGWYNWAQIGQFNDIFEVLFYLYVLTMNESSRFANRKY
jgi:hypothetical protein